MSNNRIDKFGKYGYQDVCDGDRQGSGDSVWNTEKGCNS